MTILVCGEALYDVFQAGEPVPGQLALDGRYGGSALNTAIGIARQGARVSLFTGLSLDMLGQRLLARIKAEGVGQQHLVFSGRPTTISLVGQDAGGNPSYTFYGLGSADTGLTEADIPAMDETVDALHLGSYACVVTPVGGAMLALAERYADRFISYDPNTRPTVEPDMRRWRARVDRFRQLASMIKVSTEDLSALYPGCSPLEVARDWAQVEPLRLLVLTDGPNDLTAWFKGKELRARPPPVAVADTVGAGDTVQAALLAAFAKAGAFQDRLGGVAIAEMQAYLERAVVAAAITCSRRGADMPTLYQLSVTGTPCTGAKFVIG